MASVMGTCGGLVGPKSENVEKVLVFKSFFEGLLKGRRQKPILSPGVPRGEI